VNAVIQKYKTQIIIAVGIFVVGCVVYMNTRIMADLEGAKDSPEVEAVPLEEEEAPVSVKSTSRKTVPVLDEEPITTEKTVPEQKQKNPSKGTSGLKPLESVILVN